MPEVNLLRVTIIGTQKKFHALTTPFDLENVRIIIENSNPNKERETTSKPKTIPTNKLYRSRASRFRNN